MAVLTYNMQQSDSLQLFLFHSIGGSEILTIFFFRGSAEGGWPTNPCIEPKVDKADVNLHELR